QVDVAHARGHPQTRLRETERHIRLPVAAQSAGERNEPVACEGTDGPHIPRPNCADRVAIHAGWQRDWPPRIAPPVEPVAVLPILVEQAAEAESGHARAADFSQPRERGSVGRDPVRYVYPVAT